MTAGVTTVRARIERPSMKRASAFIEAVRNSRDLHGRWAKRCRPSSPIPQAFPSTGRWGLKIVRQEGRFVFGVYRREMSAIRHLSRIGPLYGVPVTTRNWNTVTRVARILERNASR